MLFLGRLGKTIRSRGLCVGPPGNFFQESWIISLDPTSLVINNLTISEVSLLELMSIWEVEVLRPCNVGQDSRLENVLDSNRRLGLHCVGISTLKRHLERTPKNFMQASYY